MVLACFVALSKALHLCGFSIVKMLGAGGSTSRNYQSSSKGDESTRDFEGETYPSSANVSWKRKSKIGTLKCFGVEMSPDNFAVAIVYFVQGVLGLSRLAVSFYLKDDLHLDPAEVYQFCFHDVIFICNKPEFNKVFLFRLLCCFSFSFYF